MKKIKKAFTLIELIIVITILSILGVIGFIQYGSFLIDAKNSKKISDLSNISTSILIKMESGTSITSFVGGNNENKINLPSIDVGGRTATDAIYMAGTPNYRALGIKKEEYLDPQGYEYRIGVTTTYDGRFQMATYIEEEGKKISYLEGNYSARGQTEYEALYPHDKSLTLRIENMNVFKSYDKVKFNDGTFGIVKKADKNGIDLTFFDEVGNVTTLKLALAETIGLLASKDDENVIITDRSKNNLPY